MKRTKFISFILALVLVLSLVACTERPKSNNTSETTKGETQSENAGGKDASTVSGTFEGKSKGYGGDVEVKVTLEKGVITEIEAKHDKETPTIGGSAIKSLIEKIKKSNSLEQDAVSGATLSSNALITAITEALKTAGINPKDLKAKEVADEKLNLNQETDIVVVGAGGAGLSAAIKATEEGKKVIVVEKAGNTGGNTNRATGGMNAAETHYQKEKNIKDTVQQFIDDTMKGGHKLNNPELVKVMAEKSNDAIEWLDSMDAKLKDVGLAGGATNPRAHRPLDENGKVIPVGTFLIEKLTKKAEDMGVKIIYNAKVDEILMDNNQAVGVTAETKGGKLTVKAKAVVIASGGFGGSDELVSKYRPELKGYVSTNAPTIQGDAIAFLEKVNANFIDMKQIQTHPTVVQKDGSLVSESLRGDGALLLNKEGKRFVDEMQTRDFVSNAINEQKDKTAWLVVDEDMYQKSKVIQGYVKRGLLTKVDDFAGIAKFIGADAKNVEKSITNWTKYVKNGKDEEFNHKNLDKIEFKFEKAPFYVGPVGPGIHHTMGGVQINTNAQVIAKDGNPIKGLYAAGEVTGGVHGGNRLGGNAVTDIVVFGHIAGENAAKFVEEN